MAETVSADGRAAMILEQEGLLDPMGHCNICRERFKAVAETALLPCGHTVCRACAVHELTDAHRLVCPVCQHAVPGASDAAAVERLPPNVFANVPTAEAQPCCECLFYCTSTDEAEPATARCATCDRNFCSAHEHSHRLVFGKKGHTLERLSGAPGWQIDVCARHHEPLKAFCMECSSLVCLACSLDSHVSPKHTVRILGTQVNQLSAALQRALAAGRSCQQRMTATMDQVPAALKALEERRESAAQHVKEAFASLHQLLETREQELLAEGLAVASEDRTELESALCELQRRWLGLDGAAVLADRLLASTASMEQIGCYSTVTTAFLTAEAAKPVKELPVIREPVFTLSDEVVQAVQRAGRLSYNHLYGPNCNAAGVGLVMASTHKKHRVTFKITGLDGRNQPTTCGGDRIDVQARAADSEALVELETQVDDHGDGSYTVAYSASQAGRLSVSVEVNGRPIQGSPFAVQVLQGQLFEWKGAGLYDNAGILYHLGTRGGQQAWRNPHDEGLVTVMASSLGGGQVNMIVDNQVGYFHTRKTADSWVMVDLKERRVLPTTYILSHRSDGSAHHFRHWVLESSTDGTTWRVLKTHTNDSTLDYDNLTGRWSVDMPADAIEPARYLRIRQTGPNSSGYHYLFCSGFEVYGWLI